MAKKSEPSNAGDTGKGKEIKDLRKLEKSASSIEDIFGQDEDVDIVKHADELDGQEIIITGFKRLTGATGEYFFIYAFTPGGNDLFGFTCGGGVVKEKLDKVQEFKKFPLRCIWSSITPKSGGKPYYDIRPVSS